MDQDAVSRERNAAPTKDPPHLGSFVYARPRHNAQGKAGPTVANAIDQNRIASEDKLLARLRFYKGCC